MSKLTLYTAIFLLLLSASAMAIIKIIVNAGWGTREVNAANAQAAAASIVVPLGVPIAVGFRNPNNPDDPVKWGIFVKNDGRSSDQWEQIIDLPVSEAAIDSIDNYSSGGSGTGGGGPTSAQEYMFSQIFGPTWEDIIGGLPGGQIGSDYCGPGTPYICVPNAGL